MVAPDRIRWRGVGGGAGAVAAAIAGTDTDHATPCHHALCSHYGLAYSRNNLGVARENGRVESPHGHLKRRIEQALLLRGSSNFEMLAVYQAFLNDVIAAYSRPRLVRTATSVARC